MPRRAKLQEAVKDLDAQHPVASAWRPTLCEIVKTLVRGDYANKKGIPSVARVSKSTASQMKGYVAAYGETLTELPEQTWRTSIAMWMGHRWEVLVDLWTVESGASDMVLYVHVCEAKKGYRFEIVSVHVP